MALKVDRLLEVKTVEREAKVLKRLQPCPCVVRLLEQGTYELRGFMVMEVGQLSSIAMVIRASVSAWHLSHGAEAAGGWLSEGVVWSEGTSSY